MWAYTLVAPRKLELTDVPEPKAERLEDGEVLLRMLAGGICGSDLPGFAGEHVPSPALCYHGRYAAEVPGYPMHEAVGEVVASRHNDFKEGDRAVGWATRTDGLAEYVVTDGASLAGIDRGADPVLAVTNQPLACVLYAARQLGSVAGCRVAVLGQGATGLLFSHVLKDGGAVVVTGVDTVDRNDVRHVFGVDETVVGTTERWAALLSDDERPSIVVEAIGHQPGPVADAIRAVASSGLIYCFGIPSVQPYALDVWTLLRKQLTLMAGTTQQRHQSLLAAQRYLKRHPNLAEEYITDVFDVREAQQAFVRAAQPLPGRLKVVVDFRRAL